MFCMLMAKSYFCPDKYNIIMAALQVFIIGLVFGLLISYGRLNRYDTIAAQSVFLNMNVMKTIMLAIGIGSILVLIEMALGYATFHIKPFMLGGTLLGGLVFGTGMSILGYCPGTMPISLGQGSVDALVGIVGGLLGGIVFTLVYDEFAVLWTVDSTGTLFTLMGGTFSAAYIVVAILCSAALILLSTVLHKIDVKMGNRGKKWLVTSIGLAVLNALLFYKGWQNTPLGASTCYPFVGDSLASITSTTYFPMTVKSGSWQVWFLGGALVAGFLYALVTRSFKFEITHDFWRKRRSKSAMGRLFWAFLGGFLLIFGARMADGCTSGHFLSGGMQFAGSSYAFMLATMIGFLVTGLIFYRNRWH